MKSSRRLDTTRELGHAKAIESARKIFCHVMGRDPSHRHKKLCVWLTSGADMNIRALSGTARCSVVGKII
jgi:hypothetical protein